MQRKYWSILWLIPLIAIFTSQDLFYGVAPSSLVEGVLGLTMGQVSDHASRAMFLLVEKLYYLVLFNAIFGSFIYEYFQQSGVYLFSRIEDRKGWFVRKAFKLYFIVWIYVVFFVGSMVAVVLFASMEELSIGSIGVIVFLVLRLVFLVMLTTLCINLLSFRFGSLIGFLLVYIVLFLLIYHSLRNSSLIFDPIWQWVILLNPASGLLVDATTKVTIWVVTILYQLTVLYLVGLWGSRVVSKYDIMAVGNDNI